MNSISHESPRGVACEESSESLRVVLINASDRGGGAEVSTYALHSALTQLGHESRLYVGTKHTDDPTVHEISRFRSVPGMLRAAKVLEERLGWQYLYHPWFRKIDRLIGDWADVLHIHTLWSGRFGYADVGGLPRLSRLYPTLLTLRDFWMLTGHCGCPAIGCERWRSGCGRCPDLELAPAIPRDGTRFNWKRKRTAMRRSKLRVTAVSNWMAQQTRESPIFEGKTVHAVHNGVDESQFYSRDRAAVRRQLDLPQDAFIVLVAGQSVEGTSGRGDGAPDHALRALTVADRKIFLLAVGKSSQRLRARWAGEGRAVPFQADPSMLAAYYCAADVVLVASLWETFGRIPAEAQMCGVPVAAFNTGGIPEIVDQRETGLLAPRLDADALGAAVREMHDSTELRDRFSIAAAARAKRKFGNLAIAQKYVEHYRAEIALRKRAARLVNT